ncbi:MAG TPA: hypothetical protein VG838_00355 [Opitutaceae bacterium]|nr:hypothetical protein [Opitutaceae bacterium]
MKILGVSISKRVVAMGVASLFALSTNSRAFDDVPIVNYMPFQKDLSGDIPVTTSYVLSITAPTNALPNTTITPTIGLQSAPAGANTAQAVGYVSLTPSTLVFSGPGVTVSTTVKFVIPAGAVGGQYLYQILTPGWPAGTTDNGGYINMKLTVPIDPQPPIVVINTPANPSTYTYNLGGPAVSIPVQFLSTASPNTTIASVGADLSGVPITVSSTGLGTTSVTSTGTLSLSTPGIYTLTAHANNDHFQTSQATAEVTINLVAPPPTVAIATPLANSTFTYTPGGAPLSVPYSFTAISAFGGVTSLTATLNGNPVTIGTTGGLGTLTASGSGNLQITAAGTYVLAVTAVDRNGTASTTRSFTVTTATQTPGPTVTIVRPVDGSSYSRVSGSDALCIPFSVTAQAATGAKINSFTVSLNGSTQSATVIGIGKSSATATGSLTVSAAGTYTLTATATSAGTVGTDKATFTVVVTPPPPPVCTVVWQGALCTGRSQDGGSKVPVRFQIHCTSSHPDGCGDDDHRGGNCDDGHRGGDDDHDDHDCTLHETTVKVLISEIYSNGTSSTPKAFSYGRGSSDYSIDCDDVYDLDFATSRGKHLYHIDVYRFPNGGTTPQLVGTKEFRTN